MSIWTTLVSNKSLEVAQDALYISKVDNEIKRIAIVNFRIEPNNGLIYMVNQGLGPAYVHQVDFEHNGTLYTLTYGQNENDQSQKMDEFLITSIRSFDEKFKTSLLKQKAIVANPIGLLSLSENKNIVQFDIKNITNPKNRFADYIDTISVRICYTDILGKHNGQRIATSRDFEFPDCPKPPSIVSLNND